MKSCWSWIRLVTKQEQEGHLEDICSATLTQSTLKFLITNPMTNFQSETQQTAHPTLIWTQYWSLDISTSGKTLTTASGWRSSFYLQTCNSTATPCYCRNNIVSSRPAIDPEYPAVGHSETWHLSLSFSRCDFNKVTPADNKSQLPNAICTSRTVSRSRCDLARHSLQRSKAWDRQACCWRRQSMRP